MRVVLLGGWDTNNLEGCKLYGCGGLAFLICARTVQTDEGPALFLGEGKNPEIKLIFKCKQTSVLQKIFGFGWQ